MLKGTLYELEIQEPTNSGGYSTRIIFDNEQEANEFIKNYLGEDEEFDEIENNEWTPRGANWEVIKTIETDWETIILSKIVDYKEGNKNA